MAVCLLISWTTGMHSTRINQSRTASADRPSPGRSPVLDASTVAETTRPQADSGIGTSGETLESLRREIDSLDDELVALLNRRMAISRRVGRLKPATGQAVYQPDREAAVLERVLSAGGDGPLSPRALRAIYGEILSASRDLQRALRVGYLGPEGTFTHEAALRFFGSSAELVPCATIEEVFLETEKGNVDHGVVGVENSTAGAVAPTLDLLVDASIQVCGELELPVSHYLLGHGELSEVRRVCSHPQALAQCRRWLGQNLPNAERVEVASTVLAARMAEEPSTAAIAPSAAAKLYGLKVLAPRIEDSSANVTRFLVLGRERSRRTGSDKSAIVFAVKNRPGALRDALEVFARRGIDLTRIESRPSRRRLWEYVFFADFRGHPDDEVVREALAELETDALLVKVLGAWPVERAEDR